MDNVLLIVITADGYLFCLTELHDDLGCAVVPGLHDGGVVLVVEGGAAEVDQPDLGVLQDSDLAEPPALLTVLRRGVVFVRVAVVKQDVLRLQVRVRQPDKYFWVIQSNIFASIQLTGDREGRRQRGRARRQSV